jgi:hypothetical protein
MEVLESGSIKHLSCCPPNPSAAANGEHLVYPRPSRGSVIGISSRTFRFSLVYVSFSSATGERPSTTPMGSPLTVPHRSVVSHLCHP